jgi:DNA-binding transcriptional regulator YhcF (GntR family)
MLRGQTETGQLKSGQKLPPVREMAYQMGVTAGTIARSYRSLIDEGYLKVGVGQRTY